VRGALAALHRQRCQLQREVQALAGEAAPAGAAAAPGAGVAVEALASPRRRCAPLPPGVAALRAAALASLQGELLAACAALAADLDAPRALASASRPRLALHSAGPRGVCCLLALRGVLLVNPCDMIRRKRDTTVCSGWL